MRPAISMLLSGTLLLLNQGVSQEPPKQNPPDKPAAEAAQTQTLKQPLAFGLEDSTPVKLRISRNVSSADAQVNDTVDFEVLEDVKVHDVVVISRGGTAWGTVTEAQPKRRMGRGGKLNINIDNVRLASGEKAALRAVKDVKGGGHQGAMTGAIVATSIVFFPAAPLFLLVHGKDITIPKGTEITAYINGDIPLEPKKFAEQSSATPDSNPGASQTVSTAGSAQASTSAVAELSSVEIKSFPDGADITIDDKFVGDTPSTIKLTAGEHKIKIEKSGFKTWEKTLSASANGTASISATLEAK